MNKALEEAGGPYRARPSPKWDGLLSRLGAEGVDPREFLSVVGFMEEVEGPERFVEDFLCSGAMWGWFVRDRGLRVAENMARMDRQRGRVLSLLRDPSSGVREVLESPVEDISPVARYVLARSAGMDDLAVKYGLVAARDLVVAPELGDCVGAWGVDKVSDYLAELGALSDD